MCIPQGALYVHTAGGTVCAYRRGYCMCIPRGVPVARWGGLDPPQDLRILFLCPKDRPPAWEKNGTFFLKEFLKEMLGGITPQHLRETPQRPPPSAETQGRPWHWARCHYRAGLGIRAEAQKRRRQKLYSTPPRDQRYSAAWTFLRKNGLFCEKKWVHFLKEMAFFGKLL